MIYAILILLTGLSISAVAAYYSIIGLTTIFSGAVLAVTIMGSVLEIGKLVTASWLYRNWKTAGFLMKTYLTIAVIILMFITSMGIFGFLSKAHLEQTASTGDNDLQIELINNKISREEKRIKDANIVIEQLDKAVQVLIDYDRIRGPSGAISTREKQKEERESLNNIVNEASDTIASLQEQKLILEKEIVAFEVEVGPIKYIADMMYGEEKAKGLLDEAVRYVILILIVVFDPLAVLLMIAANMSLKQISNKKQDKKELEELRKEKQDQEEEHNKQIDSLKALSKDAMEQIDKYKTDSKQFLKKAMEEISEEDSLPIDEWLEDKNTITAKLFNKERPEHDDSTEEVLGYETIQEEEKDIEPSKESLEEMPEITDFSKAVRRNGRPLEEIYDELKKEKVKKASKKLIEFADGLPEPGSSMLAAGQPLIESESPKTWTDKVLSKTISDSELDKILDIAYDEARGLASISFNLDSLEGAALKRLIIKHIKNELNNENN